MDFSSPLIDGQLVKRYKRFLADVTLADGQTVTVHCANPGSMMGLAAPGSKVWLSAANNPKRKLPYSWELVEADGTLVGINTSRPNDLVAEALAKDAIPELAGYDSVRREVKYGKNSRIDLLLEGKDRPPCYVEVKNVTLSRRSGLAEFPDSVTARGAKHLVELSAMVAAGNRAVMLYLVQRADCNSLTLAADLDPAYASAFAEALDSGVEAICYGCNVGPEAIQLDRPLIMTPPDQNDSGFAD